MKLGWLAASTIAFLTSTVITLSAADPGVTLVGTGFIPGDALDRSGLAGRSICQRDDTTVCIDQAQLGGLGSGVTYSGFGNIFLAVPDRGPFDGRTDVPYLDRVHVVRLSLDTTAAFPNITPTLLDTTFLRNEWRQPFVGDAYAFDTAHPRLTRRFDPEAIAVSPFGTFYVADEYGPYIFEFNAAGQLLRRLPYRRSSCSIPSTVIPAAIWMDRAGRRSRSIQRSTSRGVRPIGGWRAWRLRPTDARSSASCRTRCFRIMAWTRSPSAEWGSTIAS